MRNWTVTVEGSERHDGEAPYTYVIRAKNKTEAGAAVLAHHKKEQDDTSNGKWWKRTTKRRKSSPKPCPVCCYSANPEDKTDD